MDGVFQAGELISARALRNISEQTKLTELQFGPGIRISRIPGVGTLVEVEEQTVSWSHPWEVRMVNNDTLEVAPGLVNGLMPWIDGRPMDGFDENGKAHRDGKPFLKFKPKGDSVWVCVRVAGSGLRLTTAGGALSIDVVEKSTWRDGGSQDEKGNGGMHVGHYPLAWMRKVSGTWKIYQIAMFNLQWRFSQKTETSDARHWFWV